MPRFRCEQCGKGFDRCKSGKRPIRFCKHACYIQWRIDNGIHTGPFRKGFTPWNKGKRIIPSAESIATQFKPGLIPHNQQAVGTITIRRDKNGRRRRWIKVSETERPQYRWVVFASWLWEKEHGKIPPGLMVHHLDGDSMNDILSNYSLVTRSKHIEVHRNQLNAAKKMKEQ